MTPEILTVEDLVARLLTNPTNRIVNLESTYKAGEALIVTLEDGKQASVPVGCSGEIVRNRRLWKGGPVA